VTGNTLFLLIMLGICVATVGYITIAEYRWLYSNKHRSHLKRQWP
jgi:hypothetical protein